MDRVLDENLDRHALKEQREMARKYRNIGIGVMGIADMLVKCKIKYGSNDSLVLLNDIMKFIFRTAVISSANNGKLLGNFPGYSSKVWDSDIIKLAFNDSEIDSLKRQDSLRNCSLISIAPTGLN